MLRPAADVRQATVRALASGKGELVEPDYATWDLSGRCSAPLNVDHLGVGHYTEAHLDLGPKWESNRTLATLVACRKCAACLKARAYSWGNRAKREWSQAPRTWFGTLTFSPDERYIARLQTVRRLDAGGTTFDALPPVDQFAELHRTMGPHVTRWFKRLRKPRKKAEGAKRARDGLLFRYLLTVEPHSDWTPHYHVLVHEKSVDFPVRNSDLESDWPHGLVHWRLVKDEKAAFYAAKYLGKYSVARVRASENYGEAIKETTSCHRF